MEGTLSDMITHILYIVSQALTLHTRRTLDHCASGLYVYVTATTPFIIPLLHIMQRCHN